MTISTSRQREYLSRRDRVCRFRRLNRVEEGQIDVTPVAAVTYALNDYPGSQPWPRWLQPGRYKRGFSKSQLVGRGTEN